MVAKLTVIEGGKRDLDWDKVVKLFAREGGEVTETPDGGWSVEVHASNLEEWEILRDSPVEFVKESSFRNALIDGAGNDVDSELAGSHYSSVSGLATLYFHEHWQAGCGAHLIVFPSLEAFQADRYGGSDESDESEEEEEPDDEVF